MALTIKQLIEKLERVEDKTGDVFIEFPGEFLSVDTVLLDNEGDITLINEMASKDSSAAVSKMNTNI